MPSIHTSAVPHWCELTADFYLTVKATLRHESADSEEDREGLGCHLGQGLYCCGVMLLAPPTLKYDWCRIRAQLYIEVSDWLSVLMKTGKVLV